MRGAAPGAVQGSFDASGLPRTPQGQIQLSGSLAGEPLTLQADVQVHPGQDVHIDLPHADWRSLHAQGAVTFAQDVDRSQGEIKWSIATLADLDPLLGQHLAGSLSGALNLQPDAPASLQVRT